MFIITDRPSKLIGNESDNAESNWNGVGNPILYKGQRRDFICNIQDNGGGAAQLLFVGQDLTLDLLPGDNVYFQGLILYQGRIVNMVSVTLVGSDTEVDIVEYPGAADIPFVGVDTGFVNIQTKENYRIQYQVFRSSDDAQLDSVIFEVADSPGRFEIVSLATLALEDAGIVNINVSPIIRSYLTADIQDLVDVADFLNDENAYVGFYIKYQEVWDGDSETLVDDAANQFFAIMGARQIPSIYGGNMGEYVVLEAVAAANFLTKFTRPKIWRRFPFILSFIGGSDLSNLKLNLYYLDSDGNTISLTNTDATLPDKLNLINITGIVAIPSNAVVAQIILYVDSNPFPEIAVITCDVVDPCDNAIMLMARNSLGGILQWVFDGSTEDTFDYGNDIKAGRKVLTAENLTANEWLALQDFIKLGEVYKDNIIELTPETIKTSTRIGHQVYDVDEDGNKLGVIAIPTRNKTETKQFKHVFELQIEYPEEFVP